jgi:hypothetical protein
MDVKLSLPITPKRLSYFLTAHRRKAHDPEPIAG